jgi:hypothetical protein
MCWASVRGGSVLGMTSAADSRKPLERAEPIESQAPVCRDSAPRANRAKSRPTTRACSISTASLVYPLPDGRGGLDRAYLIEVWIQPRTSPLSA